MKLFYILSIALIVQGCTSIPYTPAPLSSLGPSDSVGIIVSIPREYDHFSGSGWGGNDVKTPSTYDTVSAGGLALSNFISTNSRASAVLDSGKSREYWDANLNSTNPYILWQLDPQIANDLSTYAKPKEYDYVAVVEGERVPNKIKQGFIGNVEPFYGIGIYIEEAVTEYVYASLRVNVLDVDSGGVVYSSACFSYFNISEELPSLSAEVELTQDEQRVVERYIPALLKSCFEQMPTG